uniref:Macro domain-containing protein n=1 Tax=Ciona savignyi TaxID=51511 RepID=H2Z3I9_CIOSA
EVYKFVTHGGISVSVGNGNIAHQSVDAIVNAANTKLQNGAGVTGAIFKHGGPEFEKECRKTMLQRKNHPLNVGEVVEVRATGKLACKSVLHLAGPVWYRYSDKQYAFDVLKYGLESVLYKCQSHGFATLALPPVATGIYGTPLNIFVHAMLKALSTFEQKYPPSRSALNYIRILSIDDHTVANLASLFSNAIGHQ